MIDPFEYPDEVLDEICSPFFEDQLDDLTDYDAEFNGIDPPFKKPRRASLKNNEDCPSEYIDDYWIRAYAARESFESNGLTGKWLLFCPKKEIDAAWQQVKDATERNLLGPQSKVSTKKGEKETDYVICVYTKNWKKEKDVMRIREELRGLGFIKPIPYKTDSDTLSGKYYEKGKPLSKYYE